MRIDAILFAIACLMLVLAAFGVGNDDFNLAFLGLATMAAGLAVLVLSPVRGRHVG